MNTLQMNNPGLYTDIQGLESLRHQNKTHPELAQKEVSEQFESLMMHMLIKSMRDANKEFSSQLTSSEQGSLYEELFDKQLALVMSKSGVGLAKNIEQYLKQIQPGSAQNEPSKTNALTSTQKLHPGNSAGSTEKILQGAKQLFHSAADFIKTLLPYAKQAAQVLNADPHFLLAQAALETNWGKNILPHSDGQSTHNLFNIKADKSWTKNTTSMDSIEQLDGILVKEKSKFRAYPSFQESFNDYVNFLQHNARYHDALKVASNPAQFAQSLQKAHYATDPHYADKIMQILSSKAFSEFTSL